MTRGGISPMRVVVVTHEASRTGAPRVAQMVVRALAHEGHAVAVVSRRPGPLVPEFAALAPTEVEPLARVRRRATTSPWRWSRRIGRSLDVAVAWADLLRRRPDLVYVNSGAAAAYLRAARAWPRRRVVLHVHESGAVLSAFLDAAGIRRIAPEVELVACSPSVHADLVSLTGRSADDVALLVSVPDEERVLALAGPPVASQDEVVVGCCGSVEHRKGVDLWVRAAAEVLEQVPDLAVRFVWVGDGEPPADLPDPRIEFAGPAENPYPAMAAFDIATLPSRDDPFPLVVLESMLLGVPVVAFGVGGVPVQVGDAGVVVPPGDVTALADAVRRLVLDPGARTALGEQARRRVRSEFSTADFERTLQKVVAR